MKARKKMKLTVYSALMSLVSLLFNIPLFSFVAANVDWSKASGAVITVSMVLLLAILNFFACYLVVFLLRGVGKVIVAISNFLSATCVYFIVVYKTMMDTTMLSNVFNTHYSEASGFLSVKLILAVIVFGVLPAIYIVRRRVDYGSWKRFGANVGIALGAALLVIGINSNNFLWIGKHDTKLGGLLMPWSYTVNTVRLFSHRHKNNAKEILLPDAKISDDSRTAVVLVIGESARKANFSLYGYSRETNPRLSQVEGLEVIQARSCATYTTAGVRSILEYAPTKELYEILPNYLFRTGVDVVWRTTNWGEPPVHIREYEKARDLRERYDIPDKMYDGILFAGLRERILSSDKSKVAIILHTSTSHGPMYTKYYPSDFEKFTPVCDNVEGADKSLTELVNAYDNTILYTDHLLSSLIDTLKTLDGWDATMMYVSDHGESLGENGLFMHGVPLKMAPAEQYEIPFLVWSSSRKVKSFEGKIDQHYVFHSMLDLLSVDSPAFDPQKDIFE